jgi:hypothetical protein
MLLALGLAVFGAACPATTSSATGERAPPRHDAHGRVAGVSDRDTDRRTAFPDARRRSCARCCVGARAEQSVDRGTTTRLESCYRSFEMQQWWRLLLLLRAVRVRRGTRHEHPRLGTRGRFRGPTRRADSTRPATRGSPRTRRATASSTRRGPTRVSRTPSRGTGSRTERQSRRRSSAVHARRLTAGRRSAVESAQTVEATATATSRTVRSLSARIAIAAGATGHAILLPAHSGRRRELPAQ